jgi:hypothetical protein
VVLIVALLVLITMMLAGIALMRQMNAGSSIAGNVAFKENATSAADRGIEVARQWLMANPALLNDDTAANATAGYFATWATGGGSPVGYDWDGAPDVPYGANDDNSVGNNAKYIIHRLCLNAAAPDAIGQVCSDSLDAPPGASKEGCGYGCGASGSVPRPFYRITSRVIGPRNTYSYVQVVIQ